ncbi:LacI family DNA-binding transcriptional regulator [Sodalis ligni]|jgi:LacI family transcriptional regulator|uniref:LacI family transcriptional regulator n=1 Tax=Sodalis ligni TaxID=2697027 RepID=A0A4R1N7S5_9GAMM|nr:LacI family DNA-binding transcriptional regulator [Sodalis ligni]TCL03345.1 LacI family transcriptional regulator [Sodalis ligni]
MSSKNEIPVNERAGIRQVAELAGVGIASVSRVLSGQPGVSKKMTERVLQAAEQLNYTPNVLAQSLRRRSTKSIGFVCSDITNPLLASIVSGAESVLAAAGYSLLLTNSGGMPEMDAEHIDVLQQRQVDGLILLPSLENDAATLHALRKSAMPLVVIDRTLPDDVNANRVLSDHYLGVGAAARALLQQGHRRIGLIVGRDVRPTRERIRAVRDAYLAYDAAPDYLIETGILSIGHGERAMARLLALPWPPTAVILGGNQLLEGALKIISQRKLTLGRDFSLVCCDDVALSRLFSPPIATVMRDNILLGKRAAQLLLGQLDSPHESEEVLLPTWFENRGSCGPVAPARNTPDV